MKVPTDETRLMRRDRFRLRRERNAEKANALASASTALYQQRTDLAASLDLEVAPELPIAEQAPEILELIKTHQVVVVAGETGSGKTTQLAKICLQAGLGVGAMIGHTQPRRMAARTVAERIAEEVGCELGGAVGYSVRFSDQSAPNTLVRVMTDGLLLSEIRRDRYFDAYDVIILDEAHERSLNIDFLLGYLRRLLNKRRDLKIIITSATIDVGRFSEYFGGAPIVEVGGRNYPVTLYYSEPGEEPLDDIVSALSEIEAKPLGPARDVLVFCSGEREIFDGARRLRQAFAERLEILPLYARLSVADQRKVFNQSGSRRRVILATNVAETSLTVPNIGYVIDPGFARISRYSYRSKLQRLPIEAISRASADQRKGRCGRIAPGTCYRLYSEDDFQNRPAFTDAEILRVNLASVVLQMHALGLGDIARFPFIDPPEPKAIKDAQRLLEELRALEQGQLTPIGRQMARIPIDPRLAAMLVEANRQGCLREMLIIAAGLAVQDPRERPMEKASAADTAHEMFVDEASDFMTYLNLWRWVEDQRLALTRSRWMTTLRKRYINPLRVREWREIHRQLRSICRELGMQEVEQPGSYQRVHEAILAGSLSLIARHDERGRYVGPRNLKLSLFPGSGLSGRTPRWVVAAEMVETRRVFARCVAQVESRWIEQQGAHLLKQRFSEPVWSLKRGEAIAYQSISLYGLVLAERRPMAYARVDPAHCRDLLIRDGLVCGAVAEPLDFLEQNLALVARLQDAEAKGRRRDLVVSDDEIYRLYDQVLPAEMTRIVDLRRWYRRLDAAHQQRLFFEEAHLIRHQDWSISDQDFPNCLAVHGAELALSYRFAPGESDDGITLTIPAGLVHAVGTEMLQWSVPGMLPKVVEYWLRALPKAKRRALAPLADKVDELVVQLLAPQAYRQGRLLSALAQLVKDRFKVSIDAAEWDAQRLPVFLQINCRVVDAHGQTLAAGRDLGALKRQLQGAAAAADVGEAEAERDGIQHFPEGELPEHLIIGTAASSRMAYPGLQYLPGEGGKKASVGLRLFVSPKQRDAANRLGFAQLALLNLGKPAQFFRRQLAKERELGLYFASLGSADQLFEQLMLNVAWYCYFDDRPLPKTTSEFDQRLQDRRGALADVFNETILLLSEVLRARFEIVRLMEGLASPAYQPSVVDINQVLEQLAPKDVLTQTPWRFLSSLPRYLRGLEYRVQQLDGHVPRDRSTMAEVQPLEQRLAKIRDTELFDPVIDTQLKFYIQELRLKLFAEPLAKPREVNSAFSSAEWKISVKRVAAKILEEEQRVGLA